jgi:serine/threonine-protein kinase
VALAPSSGRAYLVRARVRRRAGRLDLARRDVARALAVDPNDPRAWELSGQVKTASGDPAGGLADIDRAIALGEDGSARAARAAALMALNDPRRALGDWSLALARDPEDPSLYLGRARAFIRLRQWDQALADLEQAAGWADGRPALGLRVALSYGHCLVERPGQFPRLVALLRRSWGAF